MADNPFNALLDPEKQGTITGFIGGLMGNPTAKQAAGSATGRALQELSQLQADGKTPQQALVTYLQSPGGIDFFTQAGPEGLKSLTSALTASTPPSPELHNVAPGGQLFAKDEHGRVSQIAANPTTEMQNFASYSRIAQLPTAKIRELAALNADPRKEFKPSDTRVAVDNLVNNFGMDPKVGEGIIAGTIKVLPIKDQYGQDTGDVSVVDLTNNSNVRLSPGGRTPNNTAPGSAAAPKGTTPPVDPTAPDPNKSPVGVIPPSKPDPVADNPYFGKKSNMFLGAGLAPNVVGAASKVGENIDSRLVIPEGAKAQDRETLIAQLRSSISGMSTMGEGLSVNKSVVQNLLDLVPSTKITSSPHESVSKGIRLLQNVQQEIAAEEKKTTDANLPQQERVASAKRMEGWRRVERNLPTMDEMVALEKDIREGKAGALTLSEGTKQIVGAGKKAVKSATDQATDVSNDVSGTPAQNFDAMGPSDLLKVDPKTLSRPDQIKYLRRVDQLTKGGAKKNGGK
jgi:hypothetical protein